MKKDFLYSLRKLHGDIHFRKELKEKYFFTFIEKLKKNPKTVFLIMTPDHENLGDHAIALAEIQLLKENNIDYIEITSSQIKILNEYNMLNIMNGYPILIHGGGNLGTLWFDAEYLYRHIVIKNPDSKIFVLPNTIYYGDSKEDQENLYKSIDIYNNHKHLYFYAREKISYITMTKVYKNVKLIPDMVLSLNIVTKAQERKGCILCLRNDRERTLTDEHEQIIYKFTKNTFSDDIKYLDMIADRKINPQNREEVLYGQFNSFSKAELVITDRLHGMIFCAITGTPCIVLDSKSPKLRGCYEWIKNLNFIKFANDVKEIENIYKSIPQKIYSYDNNYLLHYYQELIDDIFDILNWR